MSSLNTSLLTQIANSIRGKTNGLMGSKWNKDEVEEIATEIIILCSDNFKKNGLPFVWYKNHESNGCPININYPAGLRMLLSDGSIIMKDYTGDLTPPENTVHKNGVPQVLRATNSLLEYAEKLIG